MRVAIISDVHANLEALNAVLEDLNTQEPEKIIFLGDVVGYGANPNECCEKVREIADVCIMGNHDAALIGITDLEWFSENARFAIEYQQKLVSKEFMDWLGGMKWTHEENNVVFAHGSPLGPENFDYVIDPIRASFIMSWLKQEGRRASFVGHAHQVLVFSAPQDDSGYPDRSFPENLQLNEHQLYVINVGSVGQPRDGDPRAAYALYDTDNKTYEVRRVLYDIDLAAKKIKDAGLPDFLWQRLFKGV